MAAPPDNTSLPTRDELLQQLRRGIVTLTFRKLAKDGEREGQKRVMRCSLIRTLVRKAVCPIQNPIHVEQGVGGTDNAYQFRVYDLDKDAVRSFYFASLLSIDDYDPFVDIIND